MRLTGQRKIAAELLLSLNPQVTVRGEDSQLDASKMDIFGNAASGVVVRPVLSTRTNWTRHVPHPVLIGYAARQVCAGAEAKLTDSKIYFNGKKGVAVAEDCAGTMARNEVHSLA